MAIYILIDNNSGFIFGDSRSLENEPFIGSPIEFAQAVDKSAGEHGRAYTMLARNPRSTVTGYDVFLVDESRAEAVPFVRDGQDQETIEAVRESCEYVGFIECHEAPAL